MEQIIRIFEFIFKSFLHIWPYLLVTIPLSVAMNLSGASKYINKAFGKNPLISVFFATIVGAFSPFCSCGVIPVVSSLLIGGVPLAPVMSFWIASPSMDPEIFFLSSSVLGWKLAVWRLASTFVISLLAGYVTHFATIKGFISNDVLRSQKMEGNQITFKSFLNSIIPFSLQKRLRIELVPVTSVPPDNICCLVTADLPLKKSCCSIQTEDNGCNCHKQDEIEHDPKWVKLFREIMKATLMVTKFMGIAFLITALINLYLPENLIAGLISGSPAIQVVLATLIGIPMYTSNISALPIVGGLVDLGLNKGAALSFLIAGATTTLPAMVAVFGITKRRVFLLYLLYALLGALFAGLSFNLFNL